MPQIPIIIPVIVIGITVGSVLKSEAPRISRRKLLSASLIAGVLNAINAYVVDTLSPQQTFTRTNLSATQAAAFSSFSQTSEIVFVAASFIGGFLIVLAALGIAMIYARRGKGSEQEELPELTSEPEPKIKPS